MILFLISFLIILLTSYLLTSVISKKNDVCGLFYIPLISFANIVFTFELLSLFNSITEICVLVLNVIILFLSIIIWNKQGRPLWSLSVKRFLKKLKIALFQDKYLLTLFIGFCIFITVSVFIMLVSPVVNSDASAYHVVRCIFWITNKNLNHFDIADIRNLVFPINSEILYMWVILFTKTQLFLGFFSFVGYLLSITGIYNILSLIKFNMRKKLWVSFIVTSFSSVVILSSGTETDIIISGLILSSICLFWNGLKNNRLVPIFISSLAYALAIGTKTTAFLAIPGVALGFCALSYYYRKKEFYKPFLFFLGAGTINFILFAVYNYILNFTNYGNIAGAANFVLLHKNVYGLRAIPAHFIKYLFLFVDFTGFKWADYVGNNILAVRDGILASLNLSDIADGVFTAKDASINKSLLEPLAGMGVVGMLTFIPCLMISFIRPIFSKNKRDLFILGFGILFVINLLVMSEQLIYMTFSIRFLTTFCLISAPILVYSYSRKNNIYKFLVVFFAMFSLVLISTHIWARPFFRIVDYLKNGANITQVREILSTSVLFKNIKKSDKRINIYPVTQSQSVLAHYISGLNKSNKMLYASSITDEILPVKMLTLKGYEIDFELMENLKNIDLDKYNILITINDRQKSTLVKNIENEYCSYTTAFYNKKLVNLEVNCILSDDFFDKYDYKYVHGFDMYNYNSYLITDDKPIEKDKDTEYYKIYENKNNLIRK